MTRQQLQDLGEYALRAHAAYDTRPALDRREPTDEPTPEPVLRLSSRADWSPWSDEEPTRA